jgi:hypothetical protein
MSKERTIRKVENLPQEAEELTPAEAEAAQGGRKTRLPKLLEAAVKGKVFKKVETHGTA